MLRLHRSRCIVAQVRRRGSRARLVRGRQCDPREPKLSQLRYRNRSNGSTEWPAQFEGIKQGYDFFRASSHSHAIRSGNRRTSSMPRWSYRMTGELLAQAVEKRSHPTGPLLWGRSMTMGSPCRFVRNGYTVLARPLASPEPRLYARHQVNRSAVAFNAA